MKQLQFKFAMVAMLLSFALLPTAAYDFTVDGIYYNVVSISDLTCEVTYEKLETNEYSGNFVIPSEVTYNNRTFTVTSIGNSAFYYCSGLTSITIPSSVTSIGNSAFEHCSELTSVTIPSSVTSIGNSAFEHCSGLTSVTIPNSVTSIGERAFEHCSGLTSVTIPNSVTEIAYCAFRNCSGLTSFTIPNSVTEIDCGALGGCVNLQEVELGGGLQELPYTTWSGLNHYSTLFDYVTGDKTSDPLSLLTKLRIADSENALSVPNLNETGYFSYLPIKELYLGRVLKYEEKPFKETPIEMLEFGGNCKSTQDIGSLSSLKTLILGENIKEIRDYLSYSFIDIYIKTSIPPTVTGSINNKTYLYANLYVPKGSIKAYQNAEVWKDFWNIKEWDPSSDVTSISSIKNSSEMDITVEGRNICIKSANNSVAVRVYNASGSLVYQGTESVIPVNNAGLYIVRAGEQTKKIMVQ